MIFRACPARAGTPVTLGANNIAFFFVLASKTRKNTSTPPLKSGLSPDFCWNALSGILCVFRGHGTEAHSPGCRGCLRAGSVLQLSFGGGYCLPSSYCC